MDHKRCPGCMKEISQPVCPHCGWSAYDQNAPHQLPVGTVLNDKYIIGRALGQGGFGITYLGWDKYLEQRVAIKEYYPSGSVMRESEVSTVVASYGGALAARYQRNKERFLREAQILARFNEEKEIVHVSSMFEANNTAYFVMEFVDGITLKQHVKNSGGTLGIKETFALLRPVMNALEKLHKAGLVHRDISPDNIMLLPGGGVKLIDFGAVRNVGNADQEMPLTKSTEAILKQGYAPIEQYQNRGSLGPWTDVYALCATILYCLTGEVPPDAPERLLTEAPLEIEKRIPKLSAHQASVLERGMAMHPRDRIASMNELQKQLFSPIAKLVPPPPPKKEEEPAPQPKKRKWLIPAIALLAVLAIALAVPFTQPKTEEPVPTVPTPTETEPVVTEEPTEPTEPLITGIPAEDNILPNSILEIDFWTEEEIMAAPEEIQWYATKIAVDKYLTEDQINELADSPVFGNERIRREAVVTLTFHDALTEAPADAWDVSQKQNGCVLAWAEQEGSYYNLHIGAEGGVYAPENSSMLFAFYRNLEQLDFGGAFHTENATDMSWMFYKLEVLEELDLSSFDTSNVTNMSNMFMLASLTELDVSSFNTSNVTNMSNMFGIPKVTELDVSSFDTSKVTDMSYMFSINNLTELDVSNFDTSNVTNMSGMLWGFDKLTELDVSNFNTSNVTDMSYMFGACESIKKLDLGNFDTSKVTNMQGMFAWCTGLKSLNISSFDTSNVTDMSNMFNDCHNLPGLDLRNFNTSKVTNMSSMFACNGTGLLPNGGGLIAPKLMSLNLTSFDTSNVTDMSYMFENLRMDCLDLSSFDTHSVTNMDYMFCNNGGNLTLIVDREKFNTSNVDTSGSFFTTFYLSHRGYTRPEKWSYLFGERYDTWYDATWGN